jgi:hypothetical protein
LGLEISRIRRSCTDHTTGKMASHIPSGLDFRGIHALEWGRASARPGSRDWAPNRLDCRQSTPRRCRAEGRKPAEALAPLHNFKIHTSGSTVPRVYPCAWERSSLGNSHEQPEYGQAPGGVPARRAKVPAKVPAPHAGNNARGSDVALPMSTFEKARRRDSAVRLSITEQGSRNREQNGEQGNGNECHSQKNSQQ